MYHTWFFQKRLADELNRELKDLLLLACFSQQKDELILSFSDKKREIHLKADFDARTSVISVQKSFARARRNSVDLFSLVTNQKVLGVESFKFERSFRICFENEYDLIFKMHGSRSNVLLAKNDSIKALFRGNLIKDKEIVPSGLGRTDAMNEELFAKLLGRSNMFLIDGQTSAHEELMAQMKGDIYLTLDGVNPVLSLVPIEDPKYVTGDAIEASNKFAEFHYRFGLVEREKYELQSLLQKMIKQAENYISKTSRKLEQVQTARNPEELGHLIMANLHDLSTGQSSAVFEDLYMGGQLKLKLNPNISPQKNAENYYRKSKNRKKELDKLEENIANKTKRLKVLSAGLEYLKSLSDVREVRKLKEKYVAPVEKEVVNRPYHVFESGGWTVFVGKNAKTNDELTQRVAKKNDLWLHARDVSGSHVIIRERPGTNFSHSIIERAASIAAWYSKRRTDTLCPVIYTPRKYVRKLKGAPAGQVVVDREEVVMVEPSEFI